MTCSNKGRSIAGKFLQTVVVVLAFAAMHPAQANEDIRRRFEALAAGYPLRVGDETLRATDALQTFYESRQFALAWSDRGDLIHHANDLLIQIEDAEEDGLQPRDYFLSTIRGLIGALSDGVNEGAAADLDLLLSDAFLLLGSHLALGKVNPETIDPEWVANRRELDMVPVLEEALATDSVARQLQQLRPGNPGYQRLKDTRRKWLEMVSEHADWPAIPRGALLRPGQDDPRIPAIRDRLQVLGDLGSENSMPAAHYGSQLEAVVRQFQARHGLATDGAIGDATIAALNVTPNQRLRTVDLNLERWRWLPRELGRKHVLVNIAGFDLRVVEDGRSVLEKRVVVGRDFRRTPVISDRIRYIVFNPTWTVPTTLALKDKLPEIRRDPTYLGRLGFTLYDGWGENRKIIDPATVDWDRLPPDRFPFQLVQSPGPQNALGQVKFMFPNKFDVYLHDTPSRELFRKSERAFSSGCVRVQDPLDLAELLLNDDPGWTRARIDEVMASGETLTVHLKRPVPVHLQYWTAWVDADGVEQFRNDIYERDAVLTKALQAESL